ncbi:MAG: hypothetical protein K6U89_02720 [Chloroflexi bacterium]|nr:hypothetical protein [Chloroflexota bacterium]GIW09169.1 MAG: hypothetical protein KatS3mg061_0226 [Dehalococcoidia bacterium]
MRTEIFEADPFSGARSKPLATIDTDYRFEKNDEFTLETGGQSLRLRVTHVRVRIRGNDISREITALKV